MKAITLRHAHAAHHGDSLNMRVAVFITRHVSTMMCAYIFTLLAIVGLFGLLGWLNPFFFLLTTWISQQFLQLVFLPILSVGQGVLGKHAELQSEETARAVQQLLADMAEVKALLQQRTKR